MERRFLNMDRARVEVRADGDAAPKIVGYGAAFFRADNPATEYWLWDDVVERIMPGAFKNAVKQDDIRGLFNHDPNMVLGRRVAGTMAVVEDETGLRYEITPPQSRGDVIEAIKRGDVTGSSFSFLVRPGGAVMREEMRDGRAVIVRELTDLAVFDAGPVTFPAYEATSAQVRSAAGGADISAEVEAFRKQRAADKAAAEAMRQRILARVRVTEIDAGV